MVALDIAAPILLIFGMKTTSAYYSIAPFLGAGFCVLFLGEAARNAILSGAFDYGAGHGGEMR